MSLITLKYIKVQEVCQLLSKRKKIMRIDELEEMQQECAYWSTVRDIVDLFDKYGMDNVLVDVGNLKISMERDKVEALEEEF